MKPTFTAHLLAVTLILGSVCDARAGLLEETCDLVYKKLNSGPSDSLTKSIDKFVEGGKTYRGCVIRLLGNASKVTNTQSPDSLFGLALPYCPDGKLPANLPGDFLNEDGWCGDKMGDGPDGTSFVAIKKNVFCSVQGHWDGGDDSDPKYVRSPRYEVVVKCANR